MGTGTRMGPTDGLRPFININGRGTRTMMVSDSGRIVKEEDIGNGFNEHSRLMGHDSGTGDLLGQISARNNYIYFRH